MSQPRRSIRQHLRFIVVSTTLVALGVALLGFAAINVVTVRAAQAGDLATQADLLARMTSPALLFDDAELARQNLSAIEYRKQVRAVAVYQPDGKLFASFRAPGYAGAIPDRPGPTRVFRDGEGLVMFTPIVREGAVLGTLYLRASEDLAGLVWRQVGVAAAVGLLALAIALAMVRRLGRILVRPITSVAAAAREVVAQGDYSRRVERVGEDELGDMVDAFNDMLAEIERGREGLEARVQDRTRELEQSNRELAAMKMRAEEANVAKSSFLASMSHEIRTPMNGVIGMVDVLHQTSLNGHQVEMVDLVRESAFSLLTVIDDILDFSKIEADRIELEQAPIRLGEVIEKSCGLMDSLALRNDVEFLSFVDPRFPAPLIGDALRLRQIIVNLLNNAIKFSGGGENAGRVSLRAELIERTGRDVALAIEVRDNGIGMSAETCSRLFTAFSQADTSTTRRFGGTGLGLVISRRLAELMGGRISVQSELGRGSTFTLHLRLPLAPGAASPALGPTAAGLARLPGLRCVAIGGDGGIAADVGAYLAQAGMHVDRAHGLGDARELVAQSGAGLRVWVVDGGLSPPGPQTLRAAADGLEGVASRFVVLGRGPRREPLQSQDGFVELDGNVLSQRRLLRAVAMAAGLEAEDPERHPAARDRAVSHAPTREQARRTGRLILVAEDNETNRKVILRQLSLLGYTADVAENGEVALARWRSGDYAMLLTDLHMPLMDGYELTAAVRREEPPGKRAPILALSANALRGEADRCRAGGMDDYLSKPLQLANLNAALQKWLPGDNGDPPLDVSILQGLIGGGVEDVRAVLADFRRSAERISSDILAACRAGDAAAAGRHAHKLKSAARTVGAQELGLLCERIEAIGRGEFSQPLAEVWPRFESEMRDVTDYLDRWPGPSPAEP